MNNTIGETAGKIYKTLESNGELSVNKIKNLIGTDAFTAHTAIGWLAREDKVEIFKKGRSLLVSLK